MVPVLRLLIMLEIASGLTFWKLKFSDLKTSFILIILGWVSNCLRSPSETNIEFSIVIFLQIFILRESVILLKILLKILAMVDSSVNKCLLTSRNIRSLSEDVLFEIKGLQDFQNILLFWLISSLEK